MIKQFNLSMSKELHENTKITASKSVMSMNNFINKAIQEKIEREVKNGKK